jgi:hypothetical protein
VWRWGKPKLQAAIVAGDAGASDVVARRRRDGGINIYEKYRKTTTKPRALWDDAPMRTEQGTRRVRELLGVAAFDHPKPVELVARCLQIGMGTDGLVLDPFAGSGTTADAVAQLNAADGGRRRSLSIQLPEKLPADAAAHALGCETIADVTVARIRAAYGDVGPGLRVFRHVPAPEPTRAVHADPRAWLAHLAATAEARAARRPDAWQLAVSAGVTLDVPFRRAAEVGWWMEGPSGPCLVVTTPRLTASALAELDPPDGTAVACAAAAFDDACAAAMLARGLMLHVES